jgi:ABC-type uncharacterized transport system permease subunit
VTETTAAAELREPQRPGEAAGGQAALERVGDFLLRSVLPLVLALGTGAIILAAIGVDPVQYYKDVYSGGSSSRRGKTRPCALLLCCSSRSAYRRLQGGI